MKTPSSLTLRATQRPTRSRWQRSDSSSADVNDERDAVTAGWQLEIYEAAIKLAEKLIDTGGSGGICSEFNIATPYPSPTLLHYEASRIFSLQEEDDDISK